MGLLWFVDKNEELFCYILSLYLQVKVVDLMRIQSTCRSLRSLLNSDVASFLWKYQVDMCLVCYEREHNAMRYFVSQGVSYEAYWKGAACRHNALRKLRAQWGSHTAMRILIDTTKEKQIEAMMIADDEDTTSTKSHAKMNVRLYQEEAKYYTTSTSSDEDEQLLITAPFLMTVESYDHLDATSLFLVSSGVEKLLLESNMTHFVQMQDEDSKKTQRMLDQFLKLERATLLAGGRRLQHYHEEFRKSDEDVHQIFRSFGDLYIGRIDRTTPWRDVTDACYDFCNEASNELASSAEQMMCMLSHNAKQMLRLRGGIQDLAAQIRRMDMVVGGGCSDSLEVKYYICTIKGQKFPIQNNVNLLYPWLSPETGYKRNIIVATRTSGACSAAVRICGFTNLRLNNLLTIIYNDNMF